MQTDRPGGLVYVIWVVVAVIATVFLNGLLRERLGKEARYRQARNAVLYVLLAMAAVYAAFAVVMG